MPTPRSPLFYFYENILTIIFIASLLTAKCIVSHWDRGVIVRTAVE